MNPSTLQERYAAAESVLPDAFASLVHGGLVVPTWIGDGPDFTYIERTATGKRHCRVDGSTGEVRPLFDHEKLAAQLSELLGVPLEAGALPLGPPRIIGEAALYQLGPFELAVDLGTSTVTPTSLPGVGVDESLSPDGSRVVFRREENLWVRERATAVETQLTFDRAPAFEYGASIDVTKSTITLGWLGITLAPSVVWSPDSTKILTPRIDQRDVKEMHLVAANPRGGGPPKLHTYRYAMVGDEHVPMAELVCIDVTTGSTVVSHSFVASYFDAVRTKQLWWSPGGEAMCLWYGRGLKSLTLFAMNPETGAVREVHEKTSELITMPTSNFLSTAAMRSLPSGETLWWSECSGWGHISVIAADGSERVLTFGDWAVVDVVAADLEYVWFTAVGREPDRDPYIRSFYRVGLAGGEIETLLSDGLDHLVQGSPDARRFVDVASYLDSPPASSLLAGDGSQIAVLTAADAGDLFAAGYQSPERFCVKGADGETDIWGVLYRPAGWTSRSAIRFSTTPIPARR